MLSHQQVELKPLHPKHQLPLASLINNKKIWDNVRDYIPFPYSEKDAEFFVNMVKDEDTKLTFAIEYQGEFCGVIGLVKQADVHRLTAEIGYWIGEPFWNKGIATTAVKLITEYSFAELGLVRIYSGIFEYNEGSMRVLEKCGYKKDCVFEKSVIKNGKIWDEHRYSIINKNFDLSHYQ